MSVEPRPAQFTRQSAERIARVVRQSELRPAPGSPLEFSAAPLLRARNVFRVASFTGAWPVGQSKTVTLLNVTSTPNTASVSNLFWPIPDAGSRNCAIAKDGTAWYLLVPQMFSASAAQSATLTTSSLEFKTVQVAALGTATAVGFSISISTCSTAA